MFPLLLLLLINFENFLAIQTRTLITVISAIMIFTKYLLQNHSEMFNISII